MSDRTRRAWRAGPTTLTLVIVFAVAAAVVIPVLAYLIYEHDGAAWIPALLVGLSPAWPLLDAWRFGIHPRLTVTTHTIEVVNPVRRYEFDLDDVTLIAPGENGLMIGSEDAFRRGVVRPEVELRGSPWPSNTQLVRRHRRMAKFEEAAGIAPASSSGGAGASSPRCGRRCGNAPAARAGGDPRLGDPAERRRLAQDLPLAGRPPRPDAGLRAARASSTVRPIRPVIGGVCRSSRRLGTAG